MTRQTPAQMHNSEFPYGGWCPSCGQPMNAFSMPRVQWNICDRCRVAFCPGSSLGDSSDDWEQQVRKLDEYRHLSEVEYFGPFGVLEDEEQTENA